MTKQEKIQKAWECIGVKLNTLETTPDENGYVRLSHCIPSQQKIILNKELSIGKNIAHGISMYRPKSLQGIENNNGWIKIESEADLPKENIDCHYRLFVSEIYSNAGEYILSGRFRTKSSLSNSTNFFTCDDMIRSYFPRVTHYKPIEKPQPPIY